MNNDKKFFLVKIHTNWADEMDIDGYIIYNEKEYTVWKNYWKKLDDYVEISVGTNETIEISFEDFYITEITEYQYDVFKKLNMLSFGHNVFNAYEYHEDYINNDEEWVCQNSDSNISRFVSNLLDNGTLMGSYPTWEIPEEFKDKLIYKGRRYAILYLEEKIDDYKDERFTNAIVETLPTWIEDKKVWEYHIRLRSIQKPFYI